MFPKANVLLSRRQEPHLLAVLRRLYSQFDPAAGSRRHEAAACKQYGDSHLHHHLHG